MTGNKNCFIELKPKNRGVVTFGDNSKAILNELVLLVTILLLSLKIQLCHKAYNVIFESNGCKIVDITSNMIM
ncbi:hypothetical protein GQ457_18G007130 [Hibiscus cannabinus]